MRRAVALSSGDIGVEVLEGSEIPAGDVAIAAGDRDHTLARAEERCTRVIDRPTPAGAEVDGAAGAGGIAVAADGLVARERAVGDQRG